MFSQVFVISCLLHLSWTVPPDQNENIYDCDSNIFCYGSILKTVQLSNVFPSSRSFVNMRTIHSAYHVWNSFEQLKRNTKNLDGNRAAIDSFVKENFVQDKLEEKKLLESRIKPEIIIVDEKYREFFNEIDSKWDNLSVKTRPLDDELDSLGTMISLPHNFIKTGQSESFPEMWQNLLIVRGLLTSGLNQSAKRIILNTAFLLENLEFIPLTNRIYATRRTQLPLLAFMMEDYQETKLPFMNLFIEQMLPALTKNFMWWINNREVEILKDGSIYKLYQYKQQATEPRPEVYKSDYILSEKLASDERSTFFAALRAIDETAFGNSSRFQSPDTTSSETPNLKFIIKDLVTVELNSVLQKYATLLGSWYRQVQNTGKEISYFETKAAEIQLGIDSVLWNEDKGIWLDWNLQEMKHVDKYYVTNLMGLLTSKCDENKVNQIITYLQNNGIINQYDLSFKHTILPTSLDSTSGELGDDPYGSVFWNVLAIGGLRQCKNSKAQKVAKNIASDLIRAMFVQHITFQLLFEYYRHDQEIELDEVQKVGGGSSAANGGLITLLNWYKEAQYELSTTSTSGSDDSPSKKESDDDGNDGEDDFGKTATLIAELKKIGMVEAKNQQDEEDNMPAHTI